MTVLPIVERELRRTARRRSIYLVRGIAAAVASLVAASLLLAGYGFRSANIGGTVFFPLVIVAFAYCLFEGLRCADTISEEKREGTLRLLFLTPLRGYDVVLGKFVAAGLRSFHGLLAILPILATTLVLGGVTAGEFWRAALVLICTLWFALAVGICTSTVSQESHQAMGRAVAWLTLITIVPPFVLGGLLPSVRQTLLVMVSPATALTSLDAIVYRTQPGMFWGSIVMTLSLAVVLLVAASRLVRRAPRAEPVTRRRFFSERWLRFRPESATQRAFWRQRALAISPAYWLALRRRPERASIAILFALPCAVAFFLSGQGRAGGAALNSGMVVLQLMLAAFIAWHAVRPFAEARQNGAIELILTTPFRLEDWLHGQGLALKHLSLWPLNIGSLCIMAAVLALIIYEHTLGPISSRSFPVGNLVWAIFVCGYGVVSLIVQVWSLRWLGMWMGLTRKKTVEAFLMTMLLGWLLPLLLFCIPAVLSHLVLLAWARSRVMRDFYRVVSGDTGTRQPLRSPPVIRASRALVLG